jgi:hypothetical protein
MSDSESGTVQGENEALRFEGELLRREVRRLVAVNRTLEAQLALARGEADALRRRVAAIERSRPWRLLQMVRGWLGRRW